MWKGWWKLEEDEQEGSPAGSGQETLRPQGGGGICQWEACYVQRVAPLPLPRLVTAYPYLQGCSKHRSVTRPRAPLCPGVIGLAWGCLDRASGGRGPRGSLLEAWVLKSPLERAAGGG